MITQKLLNRLIKHDKEFFSGSVYEHSFKFDYQIYSGTVSKNFYKNGLIQLNVRVSNYMERYWVEDYKPPTIYGHSDVRRINIGIRDCVLVEQYRFFSSLFSIPTWDVEIGLVKHINLNKYGETV